MTTKNMGNKHDESYDRLRLLLGESFQAIVQEEGAQAELCCLRELRKRKRKSWEDKIARVHRAKYQRGESLIKRKS